jgi:hypothetical protein
MGGRNDVQAPSKLEKLTKASLKKMHHFTPMYCKKIAWRSSSSM